MKNLCIRTCVCFPAILIAVLFLATVSVAADFGTMVSNAGGVRVDVLPVQLAAGQTARFVVRLNTHSVNLDYDLTEVAVLRDNQGREYTPTQWDGDPPGGHHRRGVLVFPKLTAPLSSVTLTIRDVARVGARDFTWQLNP